MPRPLRIALLVLPWLLVLGLGFLAWLAWVHFQWKDRSLWERMLDDVEAAPAALHALDRGESEATAASIRSRLEADCALIAEEAHLAPRRISRRVEAAQAACAASRP